jgi:hypothetical protein
VIAMLNPVTSVTLPRLEAREEAEHRAAAKIVQQGQDAWTEIRKASTFEAWVRVGKALQVGREFALWATGCNAPKGPRYCKAFSAWADEHGFKKMTTAVRSEAIELAENLSAIEAWRDTLSEKKKLRLSHPQTITRSWRASLRPKPQSKINKVETARLAWKRFMLCVESLPKEQRLPLWQAAYDQAAARITL